MRFLARLYAVILVVALTPVAAFALGGKLRSIEDVKAELVAFENLGLHAKALKGLSEVPASEIVDDPQIFNGLFNQIGDYVEDPLDRKLFEVKEDEHELLKDPVLHARLFRVWVDLLRHGLRTESPRIRNNIVIQLGHVAIEDVDVVDDLVELVFRLPQNFEKLLEAIGSAMRVYDYGKIFTLDDLGKIRLGWRGPMDKELLTAMRLKLLSPWSLKPGPGNRSHKMKNAVAALRYGAGVTLPLEGTKILTSFFDREWESLSREDRESFVEVVEEFKPEDKESVDLLIKMAEKVRDRKSVV